MKMAEEPIKCQFCGQDNVSKAHERMCAMNPNRPKRKSIVEETRELSEQREPTKAESQKTQPLLIIDVQEIEITDDLKAVYQDKEGKIMLYTPMFRGIWVRENMELPTLLVTAADGSLLPPSLIEGFIGMFPESAIEDAKETPKATEEQPDKAEPTLLIEKWEAHEKESTQEAQQPEPQLVPVETSTKGILDRILARKKTA